MTIIYFSANVRLPIFAIILYMYNFVFALAGQGGVVNKAYLRFRLVCVNGK